MFGALDPVDKVAICGALNTADQNIGELARAIGEYATSLIDDHKVRQRYLEAALEEAKQEKEDTGRVSAPTKEKVQEVAAEYVATDGKVQELEDKLEAYRQLPGIIGKYNKYFADLVATLQGARKPKPAARTSNVGMQEAQGSEGSEEEEAEEEVDLYEDLLAQFIAVYNQQVSPEQKVRLFTGVVNELENGLPKYTTEDQKLLKPLITELRKWINMFTQVYVDYADVYTRLPQLTPQNQDDYVRANQSLRQEWLSKVDSDLDEEEVSIFKPLMKDYINRMAEVAQATVEKRIAEEEAGEIEITLPQLSKEQRIEQERREARERKKQEKRTPTQPTGG